jgi:hypothetical protein
VIPGELLAQLPSLGICGLLFVMWWIERQERARGAAGLRDALQYAGQVAEVNKNLLDVIRANTEALTALREELRSHRMTEAEWVTRLTRQLEDLGCA